MLLNNFKKISPGMSINYVEKIMGLPNEKRNIYSSINKIEANKLGTAYIYLISRKSDYGSIAQRKEKHIRVNFNKSGKVKGLEKIGF